MKSVYSILFSFVIFSCSQNKTANEGPLVIDPGKFPKEQITLSELADDITYVTLDNTIPTGGIHSMEITPKGNFISILGSSKVHYNSHGNFISIIARNGRCPEPLCSVLTLPVQTFPKMKGGLLAKIGFCS